MTIDYNDKHSEYRQKTTAVAYARFSSHNQREESIDAQLRAIREYCDREGIILIETYQDEKQTGTNANRDEFQRMVDEILFYGKKVDLILVHKFNRFARSKTDSALYKKKLKDKGIKVVSVTQRIDDTPEGEMLESIIEAMDEYYSRNLALEIMKGLRENAIKGKWTGGKKILGYDIIDGYYVINEKAELVRRAFRERALGASVLDIVERFNAEGHTNSYGKPFREKIIQDTLNNEKYIGIYNYSLGKEVFRHENIPPIIDKNLWNAVQAKRTKKDKPKPRVKTENLLYHLTGNITCAECGHNITAGGAGRNTGSGVLVHYYYCTGRNKYRNGCKLKGIQKGWIEIAALKTIFDIVADQNFMDDLAEQVIEEINKLKHIPQSSLDSLQDELKEIKAEQMRIAQMYSKGKIPEEMLDAQADDANRRLHTVEEEIEKQTAAKSVTDISREQVIDFMGSFIKNLQTRPVDNDLMKAIFNAFLDRVEVSQNTVRIYVKVDFSKVDIINFNNSPIACAVVGLSNFETVTELTRNQVKAIAQSA